MKHLLRKLHHHPHRSNDNPQTPPPPSPSTSSSCSGAAASSAVTAEGNSVQPQPQSQSQQDYFSSEEEYQVQLALALSVSSSGQDRALVDSGKSPIHREVQDGKLDADLLSRRYWDFGILDFGERIVDGFYDVQNLSSDPAAQENMPSLADLESNTGGWNYEVIVVNRKIDPALEELLQIARCILLDCPTTEIRVLVQRLAELVTKHLGGPVHDANIILANFMERRLELRMSPHTVVLPIGSLKVGLSRHRALLFKVLADSIGIPCRLVKGSHYTGLDDDAVNIIKLHDDSECLVDLMGAPGTLIPSDIVCGKDAPSSYSRQTSVQAASSANAMSSHNHLGSVSGYVSSFGSTSWNPGALLQKTSSDHDVGTSTQSEKILLPSLDQGPSEEKSYLHAGDRWSNFSGDRTSLKSNVIPYVPKIPEDPKYVFSELNPFQSKESGNSALQNAHVREFGKQQCSGDSNANVPSRASLAWKSRHALNEVPKENAYGNLEAPLLKKSQGHINSSASSSVSRNSKVPHEVQESSRQGTTDPREKNSESSSREQECIKFSNCLSGVEMCSLGENGSVTAEFRLQDNLNHIRGHKKNVREDDTGSTAKLMKTEDAGCSLEARVSCVDTDIDDVGECEILWEDLVLGERIGLGSYGEVYRADLNGTEVAVKKFLDQDFSGAALDEFRREVRIMRRLRHPNVVQFMGAVTRPPNLSIITEFLPRGSLYRIIHRPHCHIDEKRRIKMALDVAKGMNCLHTSRPTIVHRDLKSPNLLVDNDWNVKVCDFGLSRLKHNTFLSSKSTGGTPEWMAPEILRNERSDEKCDVYSFGIILWELVTLKLPWSGMNPMQVVGAVGFQNRRLEIPKEVDPLVARIIWECWQTDPNLRPSFAQLCVALKPLKRLVIPSHVEQQSNASMSQEITVNSTP